MEVVLGQFEGDLMVATLVVVLPTKDIRGHPEAVELVADAVLETGHGGHLADPC
jgi:hypothetical protein